jgi:hypothetical protein
LRHGVLCLLLMGELKCLCCCQLLLLLLLLLLLESNPATKGMAAGEAKLHQTRQS